MKTLCNIILICLFAGCASKPLIDKDDVKLTRDEAAKSCHDLGSLEVRSLSIKPDEARLMDDMRIEARKRGANFVKIEGLGAQGTSMRGEAYDCR
jgi:hypothetical protein